MNYHEMNEMLIHLLSIITIIITFIITTYHAKLKAFAYWR